MKQLPKRRAYQVLLEGETAFIEKAIGFKSRLLSFRRGRRVMNWLLKRGHAVRLRYFGEIVLPENHRGFA